MSEETNDQTKTDTPIASGEGTAKTTEGVMEVPGLPPKSPLVGERRELVWQEVHKLEAKIAEVYGHLHDDVRESIAKIRAHLTHPSN